MLQFSKTCAFSPIYYLFFISFMALFNNFVVYWCQEEDPIYWPEETCFSFHSWLKASTSILWRNFNILLREIIISLPHCHFSFSQTLPPSPFSMGFFLFVWLVEGGIFCIQKVLCELYVSHKYYATKITTALTKRSNPSSPRHTTFYLLYKPWPFYYF